uniref:Neprosin PEP catalytic domain-containing protein n=1 Tax=Oryza glumipatula TaxID=40148 RepID=A0A0D9ZXK0_9ORYZ
MEMDVENPFISSISEAQLPSYCRMPYRNHPRVTINVYEPKVKHHWVPSGSWIQIENGTGCGDVNDEAQNKSCTDHSRPGFVQVSSSVVLGGRLNHASVYNGTQYRIQVLIFKVMGRYTKWGAYVQGPTV